MKKIIIFLTVLTGIFVYQIAEGFDIVSVPQYAFMVLTAGVLFSFTLKNKYLTGIVILMFVSIFTTFLNGLNQSVDFIKSIIFIFSALAIYKYFLEHKHNVLKYLLIPALINAVVMIVQYFNQEYFFFHGGKAAGMLGAPGFTGCFIGITAPLFLRYFPIGWPVCAVALFLGHSFVGTLAFIVSSLVWLYFKNKKIFIAVVAVLFLAIPFIKDIGAGHEVNVRISGWLGTLDGIRYHWFKGWGLGSYLDIMSQNQGVYYKVPIAPNYNHPVNEFLFGWWNFGILFPIVSIGYIASLIKQFSVNKIETFSVLVGCFVIAMGYFFMPPVLFIAMAALGLYQEDKEC